MHQTMLSYRRPARNALRRVVGGLALAGAALGALLVAYNVAVMLVWRWSLGVSPQAGGWMGERILDWLWKTL